MKKDGLGKLYCFLRGEERFRLHLEALYRGDEAEVKRLLESCPLETYSMRPADFADRCKAGKEIVDMLGSVLAPRLAQLRTIESIREALAYELNRCIIKGVGAYFDGHEAGARRAWEAAGMTGDPPGWKEQEEEPEMDRELQSLRRITGGLEEASGKFLSCLAELERELAEEVLTMWEAFAHFCTEELLLQPEKLVKVWFEPMLPEIERLKDLSASTELNPEMLEEYKAALKKRWSEVVGPD
jgi:hypothetical protein